MTLPGLGDMLRSGVALVARRWRWALLLAVLALAYLAWCRWGAVATPPAGRPIAATVAAAVANMPTKTVTVPLRVIADTPTAARPIWSTAAICSASRAPWSWSLPAHQPPSTS